MLDINILERNLNEKISYNEFFHALGYKDGDTMYLRRFDDRKRDEMLPKNMEVEFSRFDSILPTLHRYNDDLFGIFYVVNGGGHGDKEVKRAGGPARAQFVDFDDDSFQDQLRKLNEFPLEPSILIRTRKSLHAYWILDNGEMKYFREIQQRLAQHFGSDTTMQNESRVMRVFGFNHCKLEPIRTLNGFEPGTEEEPVLVTVIKFDPELRYTQRQLHEVLPLLEKKSTGTGTRERREIEKDGEIVPIGQRHYYVVSRIGTILNKIGDVASDEMIYSMLETDYLEHCEDAASTDLDKFKTKYLATIKKFREQREAENADPDFYKRSVRAWEYYNAERFDREKTSWEEVAEAGRRAEAEGLDLDQKFEELRRSVSRAMREDAQTREDSSTLYNLSALIRSIRDGYRVYYVADPEDITILNEFHYTATTAYGEWRKEFAPYFTGAMVGILSDGSPEGRARAEQIARDLKRYAFETAVISDIPGGSVKAYFEAGNALEDFKELISSKEWILAPWAYTNDRGNVNITPSTLAVNFSKTTDYIIVRNPLDDNDLFYGFEGGVYRRWNKAQIKSALRKYIPVVYQKDAQIAEAQRTVFELGMKIHSFEDLDSEERFINFKNGLYDVAQKKLIPHDPAVLSTIQLNFDYDPGARSMPVFTKFMKDLFTKEDGSIDYDSMKILQEFSGLAISNVFVFRAKKALFLCSIRGNTGKSVFMNLIQHILGEDNVTSVPIQHMNENTGRFTMGTALGKRMIINGDQTESDIGDSSYFKQLTGGDRTKMENKNQKPLMVRYRGGIMIGCNGLPSFTDDKGEHIFERLLLIMCTNVIPEEKRDAMLLDKMKQEVPAIVNWFLSGLHRLIEAGFKFTRSESAENAIHEYREQLDSVYRFIHEYERDGERFVITKNRADQIAKSTFYNEYESWCCDSENDLRPVKKKNLDQRLEALGLEVDPKGNTKDRRGIYTIRGLKWSAGCGQTFEGMVSYGNFLEDQRRAVRESNYIPPEFR